MAPHRLNLFEHPVFNKHALEIGLTLMGCVLLLVGVSATYYLLHSFSNTFYPGTVIDGYDVSGLTKAEAANQLATLPPLPTYQVIFTAENTQIASSSTELGLHRATQPTIDKAYTFDQEQPWSVKLGRVLGWLNQPHEESSPWRYDQVALTQALEQLQMQFTTPAVQPRAILGTSGRPNTLTIERGKAGKSLDIDQAITLATDAIAPPPPEATAAGTLALDPAIVTSNPELNDTQVTEARLRAETLVGKNSIFSGDDQRLYLNDKQLVSLLAFPTGLSLEGMNAILAEWQKTVTRPPQDAEFAYDPQTMVVTTFKPPKNGLHLDQEKAQQILETTLQAIESNTDGQKTWEAELPLAVTPPTKTLAETNDLGIDEVIGFGESDYDHSIPSRIHNVALTSSKISNHLLKPGEEFSFNQALGDVSAETGFKPAYVIKDGQTVLGDGGGVCQVSTTLFRAVLDAGLEVTKRRPHSYRVTYYELNQEPGFDATVYSGDVDLRFKNDTDDYILIHSEADSRNLHMEVTLYGTSDGRTTEITNYQKWDARPAPPPVYTVDASVAPGQTRQVDWAASGIRTKFTNVIKDKNGQVIREDEYASNYRPWSAKYLVGPT